MTWRRLSPGSVTFPSPSSLLLFSHSAFIVGLSLCCYFQLHLGNSTLSALVVLVLLNRDSILLSPKVKFLSSSSSSSSSSSVRSKARAFVLATCRGAAYSLVGDGHLRTSVYLCNEYVHFLHVRTYVRTYILLRTTYVFVQGCCCLICACCLVDAHAKYSRPAHHHHD